MTSSDQLVTDYLERLSAALEQSGVPASRRSELVEEISQHIEQSRALLDRDDEVALRGLLDRVGPPEAVAAEASGVSLHRGKRMPRRWQLEAAGALLGLAAIIGLATAVATSPSSPPSFAVAARAPLPIACAAIPPQVLPAGGPPFRRVTIRRDGKKRQVLVPARPRSVHATRQAMVCGGNLILPGRRVSVKIGR